MPKDRFIFSIDPELKKHIIEIANNNGISQSKAVNKIVQDHIKKQSLMSLPKYSTTNSQPYYSIDSFPNHKGKYHMIYIAYECKLVSGTVINQDQDGDISKIDRIPLSDITFEINCSYLLNICHKL